MSDTGTMTRVIRTLGRTGLGKNIVRKTTQDAYDKVMSGDADVSRDGDLKVFYEEYWVDKGVPDEVKEELLSSYSVYGQSGAIYCSDFCADGAEDVYNEYYVECEQCGGGYDSEYDGWLVFDAGCCSLECAWARVENSNCCRRFFQQNPGFDQEESMEAIKRHGRGPSYDSCRAMTLDFEQHAVGGHECEECGNKYSEGDGWDISDTEDGYCSERCAWKGIASYISDRTSLTANQDERILQKLVNEHYLGDLSNYRALQRAVDEAVADLFSEDEEDEE